MISQKSFGAEVTLEEAQVVLIPVPWEVTASYGQGSSQAPQAIQKASAQLDFFERAYGRAHNHLIYFQAPDSHLQQLNKETCQLSQKIISCWEEDKKLNQKEKKWVQQVNEACKEMTSYVYKQAKSISSLGKYPVVVGGEHSVSEGILKWVGEKYLGNFGLLHIDAHFDMRKSYQGFQHSHASVMHNVLSQSYPPQKWVQVGIRDFSEEEYKMMQSHKQIHTYFDTDLHQALFSGRSWASLCEEMISHLPSSIYISLDVDGLEWNYAPSTGTPVPGGLSFNQLLFLFKEIKKQNKKIIGFDVVETSVGSKGNPLAEWNANVSARLIYQLCGLILS